MAKPKKAVASPLSLFIIFFLTLSIIFLSFLFVQRNNQINTLQKALVEKDNELNLAINNQGEIAGITTTTYSPSDFGIYSPLFENKKINITRYLYKNNLITQRLLVLDSGTYVPNTFGAETWEFNDETNNAEAVFQGYENGGLVATSLVDIQSRWNESYINSNGNKLYWAFEYGPKTGAYLMKLEYYKTSSSTGHPLFIQLFSGYIPSGKLGMDASDIEFNKQKLEKLADTIDFNR